MAILAAADLANGVSYWPFGILLLAIVLIVVMIAVLRVHAFFALMLAAVAVGLLAGDKLPGAEGGNALIRAVELPMLEFGATAGKIGFVIALAAVIGVCLMESGAADKIVRRFLSVLGEARAGIALLASGFFLAIPVFFDTVFFLLIPLARALSLRAGKNYLFYVLAIGGGGVITHSLVAPTPGPLSMAETLNIDLGLSIVVGTLAGLLPAVGVLFLARYLNQRMDIPLRESAGASLADLKTVMSKGDDELPSFTLSILPVILPVFLIGLASVLGVMEVSAGIERWVGFFGNKNIALLLGTLIALWILARQKGLGRENLLQVVGPPLETAGVIILITSAGGAFGAMIKHSGVGDAIEAAMGGGGFSYIILGWLIAAVMKIAQGSGTVAMITTASMMVELIGDGSSLGYHPIYIFMAIGYGSLMISWMNDSGFWVVCKLSGFTESETLKSWTVLLGAIALMGLLEVLVLSWILPAAN